MTPPHRRCSSDAARTPSGTGLARRARTSGGFARYNLLLALNLVVFAGLLLWIGSRMRAGGPFPDSLDAAERDTASVPAREVTNLPPPPSGDLQLPESDRRPEPVPPPPPDEADEPDTVEPIRDPMEDEEAAPKAGSASLPGPAEAAPPASPPSPPETAVPPSGEDSTVDPSAEVDVPPGPSLRPDPPRDRAPEARAGAEAEIARLGLELEITKTTSGYYPSSRGSADDAHRGIEALHAALPETARRRVAHVGDTDGDGRPEFLDPWGRPYVFASADDYDHPQRRFDADGRSLTFTAVRAGKGFAAGRRYQLTSFGPDGADDRGGGDDLVSWLRAPQRRR